MKAELERGPHPDDFARLIAALRRLDSLSDSERRAAFEACNQDLSVLNLRWSDIADALPINQLSGEHIARAAKAMCEGRGFLAGWETQFLIGIEGLRTLSAAQQAELGRILGKVETARAAGGPT